MADEIGHVLEMMHPMREPPQPASLAPVLVAPAAGCVAAAVVLVVLLQAHRRRAGLRRAAEAELTRSRALAPTERLAAQAALLRRLVRRLAGDGEARKQGRAWLESLDAVFATHAFTQGEGVAYGDALYGPRVPDVEALDAMLARLFAKMSRRRHA